MCLVSASCCEGEGCNGQQKHLKPNRHTYQWDMVVTFPWFVFFAKGSQFTGRLISSNFLVFRADLCIHLGRRRNSRLWTIPFPSILGVSYRICRRRCLWAGFYNHHNGQPKQSNSDWSCFTFQRVVDSQLYHRIVINESVREIWSSLTMLRVRYERSSRWYIFQSDTSFHFRWRSQKVDKRNIVEITVT